MGLIKQIEKEFKQQNNGPEAVEDELLRDSVLEHDEKPAVDETEDVVPSQIRRKLEVNLGSKYEGKPVSRKRFSEAKNSLKADSDFKRTLDLLIDDEDGSNGEEEAEDDTDRDSDVNLEEASDDNIDDSEEDGNIDDDDDDEETQDEEGSDEFDDVMGIADAAEEFKNKEGEDKSINIFSLKAKDTDSDLAKGKSIGNQLSLWESILECRIKLQPCLVATNKLYQKEDMINFKSELSKVDEAILSKAYGSLSELMKKLLELQDVLLKSSPEYKKMKTPDSKKNEIDNNASNDEDEINGDDDESIASSEASGIDNENDDEENSDADASAEEQDDKSEDEEETPLPKKRKLNDNNLLEDIYQDFKPFGDSSIQKWYDKTRVASGKISSADFSAFDRSTLKQIEQILYDKDRLIKKTQLKRSEYEILGKKAIEEKEVREENGVEVVKVKERVQNEYDTEIFDDDDFYHKLLRDFIERKSTDITDPSKIGRQWLELQKMRSKMKRNVDTKASKGRKLRYTIHNKLVNFMAPIPCNEWTEEAESKLFNSLFGKGVVR